MIKSRGELHKQMERTIDANLRSLEEHGEYSEYNVKTNIIESNCSIDEIPLTFDGYHIEIKPTDDKFLFGLVVRNNSQRFVLYIDTFFGRFWKLYNMENSETINKFMDKFTNLLLLDSLWMPHQMLDNIESKLVNVGFSIKFKQEIFDEDELGEDDISRLTMRLWSRGTKPSKNLFKLLQENNYPSTKTSTRVLNIDDHNVKFLDEVFFDGKITVGYSTKMKEIENNRMSFTKSACGQVVGGSPFEIKFSKNYDIQHLAEKIINSTHPFKLWGVIHDQTDDFLRIAGVDVHTGDKFSMDLMQKYGRLYLPENACGNMVFRLYTNIQHYLDPGVMIFDEHGSVF
ncbi:MAG: hypothetical protein HF982_14020 [Desulfobacteraceae bacterium]|nr:hypothetical protein [Desulfobacteraceae bacterium]MBC2720675.1 hypothetical protein [Desulfobacteraceae bacterium]